MPGARLELARPCGAVDFESTPSDKHHRPRATKSKENQELTGAVFALGCSCFSLVFVNIGTKEAQIGTVSPASLAREKADTLTALVGESAEGFFERGRASWTRNRGGVQPKPSRKISLPVGIMRIWDSW